MESSLGAGFPPQIFDTIAALEDQHFWFRSRDRLFAWALREHAATATSMLDAGCGTGHVLARLHEQFPGLRLTGAELFAEGLSHARRHVGPAVALVRADVRRLPFSESFDVVGAFDVLEHLADDTAAAGELFRVVRPAGLLLVTVPQHRWLWSAADRHAHHERRYSAADIEALVTGAGFELVRSTSVVSLLLPAMIASRLLGRPAGGVGAELRMPRWLNAALDRVMRAELALIRRGVDLPVGGSRLVLARRPATGGAR